MKEKSAYNKSEKGREEEVQWRKEKDGGGRRGGGGRKMERIG